MPQNHDFGATLQFGPVSAVDAARHAVRVKLPALEDLETDWLPVVSFGAGGNRFYALPDPGELAVCLLDARGEGGVCVGVIYNDADPAPAADRNIWCKKFSNGTLIQHDRGSGQLTVDTPGDVLVKAGGKVTIDCENTETTGNLLVGGSLTYMQGMTGHAGGAGGDTATIHGNVSIQGGDVDADGISLKQHTHGGVQPGGGSTGAAQ